MANNRIRFSDNFVLNNEKIGINTDDPQSLLDVGGDVRVTGSSTLGFTTATNLYVSGIITSTSFVGDLSGTAAFASTAYVLDGFDPDTTTVGAAITATNVIGGIGSITSLDVSGITTLGTIQISSGIITAASGVVTYYGDGSNLEGVTAFYVDTQLNTSDPVYPALASGVGVNSVGISTSKLVFVESTSSLGIGTTYPERNLHIEGDIKVTGAYYDSNNDTGSDYYVLRSTATGTDWIDPIAIPGISGSTIPGITTSSSYVLTIDDVGQHVAISTGGVTVPADVFTSGHAVMIINDSDYQQVITSGVGITMYLAGGITTGDRYLGTRGIANILCYKTNMFMIVGAGLT